MSSKHSHESIPEDKPPSIASQESAAHSAVEAHAAPKTPNQEPSEFNARSISVLTGSALALFLTVGLANAFGVFEQYYVAHLLPNESDFDIAWIGSMSTFMLFGFAAPAGILADKLGPTPLLAVGLTLEVLSVFMLSLCKKYYQVFLAQGVMQGLAFAMITVPAASITPQYFKKNRATCTGVTVAGSSLGGVIWPIVLDQLLNEHKLGFGPSVRIMGYIMIPLAVYAVLVIKRPAIKPVDGEKQSGPAAPPPKKDFSRLRSPAALLLYIGLGFSYLGFFVPLFFVSTYGVSKGMTEQFSFYLVSIANAASLFGRILPSFYADRSLGYFNALILSCFVSGVVAFCWTAATSTAGVVVWILAYGFASGAIMSLQFVCAVGLVGGQMAGAATGITMTATSLPALFGTPIAGQLENVSYLALSCYTGAVMIVAGAVLTLSRLQKERKILARV